MVNSNAKSKYYVFLSALVIILFVGISSCEDAHPRYIENPNAYLVSQLAHKRIIMLGDFYHSAPLPYETIMSLLNEWVDEVAAGRSGDRNVVLILEADRQIVNNLKSFISGGDWGILARYWLPYNTLEWFEFCSELRQLHFKIDSLNSVKSAFKDSISLSIFGGEPYNVLDNSELLGLSKAQIAKGFVNLRDSVSAYKVIHYLDSCSSKKAIIFYGLGHLIDKFVHKASAVLPPSETGGYYLAYYLKRRFSEDSVLSVAQMPFGRLSHNCWAFPIATHADILVPSRELSKDDFVGFPSEIQPGNFDAVITRNEFLIPGHPLCDVFGKEVIKADINRLAYFRKFLPGAIAQVYYDQALNSLELITGKNFHSLVGWKNWLKGTRYDGFKRIDSRAMQDEMFDRFYENTQDVHLREMLYDMGFRPVILNTGWTPTKAYWRETLWPHAIKDIKVNTSIGLLWVGTLKERMRAASYLMIMFGRPPLKPQSYLKLVRNRYYNAQY